MAENFKFSLSIEAFTKGFRDINTNLKEIDKQTKSLTDGFNKLGQKLTIGLTAPIALFAKTSISAFRNQEKALAKFTDSFAKNGSRLGLNFQDLTARADEFAANTLFDDDDILGSVTSQLLSFQNISKEVFDQTQGIILDFAAKTGDSLEGATSIIARALQNPTEGLAQLRRANVAFTDSEVTVIEFLDKAGRSAEAQALILEKLKNTVGGFAVEAAKLDSASVDKLAIAFTNLRESAGQAFITVLGPLIDLLTRVIQAISELSAPTQVAIAAFAAVAAAIGPILLILPQLITSFNLLRGSLALIAGPAGILFALVAILITVREAFGTFGNAATFLAFKINEIVLGILDLIDKIPTALAVFVPALGTLKIASTALRETIENNIKSLDATLKDFIENQDVQETADITAQAADAALKQSRASTAAAVAEKEASRIKLAEANEKIRQQILKDSEAFLEAQDNLNIAINTPVNADQVATTQVIGEFSELTKEVRELTQAGEIVSNSFTNAFTNMTTGAESASQAIKNLGRSLLQAFANALLQRAFNSIVSGIAGLGQTTTVPAGQSSPGLFGGGFAEGGLVRGPGTGTSDSMLARVSNGEFWMQSKAVKHWGVDFMNAINKGILPAFANGGIVSNMGSYLNNVPRFATGGIVNARQPSVSINVLPQTSQPVNVRATQSVDVRGTVVSIILEDLKTNGPISQGNQQAFGLRR